jgi:hypothetical protein
MKIPQGARPGLGFLPPARRPWLLALAPLGAWLYVRFGNRVRREELFGTERLVEAYREMQEGAARVIVAFRHPGVEDGTVVFRLMCGIVAREARRLGVKLRRRPRGYFLFGRDVPEWAGRFLNWMLPLLGAIPVFPGRFESQSIATLRRYLTDMPHPIALAPEGQVTYHNDRVAALEPGTAQLAFWCLEDLKSQSRSEDVVIVPVCTSYHYEPRSMKGLLKLMDGAEKQCGIAPLGADPSRLHERVARLLRRLIDIAEDFYTRYHGATFVGRESEESPARLQERMRAVCEAALAAAEAFFGLRSRGDFVQRVFRTRQAGLQWMFREDIPDLAALSPVERALADRKAVESWWINRHVELVDLLEYLRTDYLHPDSPFDRFVEYVTNLVDLANRLSGGNISGRKNPFPRTARIIVNEPLRVGKLWPRYAENRRQAVAALTAEVLASFKAVAESGNLPVP